MTWVPHGCTLPTVDQPMRVAEFDELFSTAVQPATRVDATSLTFHLPPGEGVVMIAKDLIARETGCCSFFAFDLHTSAAGTELEVCVPLAQVAVLDAMQQQAELAWTRSVYA